MGRAPFNEATNHFTAFQDQGDARHQADHPRNQRFDSSVAFVGRQVLEATPKRLGVQLCEDPRNRLLEFVSRVAGRQLYRSRNENGSVYSYLALPHHGPPWHFDESHFTAILYLQNSSAGGAFEFVPWSRPSKSKDDPRSHEAVREMLVQDNKAVVERVEAEPGSLVFFAGCHALHRAARCAATPHELRWCSPSARTPASQTRRRRRGTTSGTYEEAVRCNGADCDGGEPFARGAE